MYRRRMAEYLVELYVSREDSAAVESGAERARAAAEKLADKGEAIRYVRTIFVPEARPVSSSTRPSRLMPSVKWHCGLG